MSSRWGPMRTLRQGEGNPIFTPADGAYPGGACFRHERVEGETAGFSVGFSPNLLRRSVGAAVATACALGTKSQC